MKLVTLPVEAVAAGVGSLIHTSVKLVTCLQLSSPARSRDFNPHEREARDEYIADVYDDSVLILIHTSVKLVTSSISPFTRLTFILIHTSVKLVTTKWGQIVVQ